MIAQSRPLELREHGRTVKRLANQVGYAIQSGSARADALAGDLRDRLSAMLTMLGDGPADAPVIVATVKPVAAPDKIVTGSAPTGWIGQTLYHWGEKGLRATGNDYIKGNGSGRPRKSFDTAWIPDAGKVWVPNARLVRALKSLTDEVWPVKERKGKFWSTRYYLSSKQAIAAAREKTGEPEPVGVERESTDDFPDLVGAGAEGGAS